MASARRLRVLPWVSFMIGVLFFVVVQYSTGQRLVTSGSSNNCVILSTNDTKCWGEGGFNGNQNASPVGSTGNTMGDNLPSIDWGTDLIADTIVVGKSKTTCAIVYKLSDPILSRQVKCFGANSNGLTGRGTSGGIIGDALGEMGTGLTAVDLGTGLLPVAITVGGLHACAIVSNATINGGVKCWGLGDSGQLGNGLTSSQGGSAGTIGDGMLFVNLNIRVIGLTAGHEFTCFIASDVSLEHGDVYCTGINANGQLGQGSLAPSSSPLIVDLGAGLTASKITAGASHICALIHQTKQVKCWGTSFERATGVTTVDDIGDAPLEMGDHLNALDFGTGIQVTDVVAGSFHTCVILSNNQLRCFGNNERGQLGQENTCPLPFRNGFASDDDCPSARNSVANIPAINLGGFHAISVSAGVFHTCVLVNKSGGSLKCFGYNQEGQLGYEDTNDRGSSSFTMGSNLDFVNVDEPSSSPTKSPTVSSPTFSPSKSPTQSKPTASPTTSSPSKSPSGAPSKSPTIQPSQSPAFSSPSLSPSRLPTTRSPVITNTPTLNAAQATVSNVGVGVGAAIGATVFALLAYVVFRRRKTLFGNGGAGSTIWLAQVDFSANRDAPSPYAAPLYATAADQSSFVSGNPIYTGIASSSSVSGTPPKSKITRDQILQKLMEFYNKVEPGKNVNDISDLADWANVNGEEALYVKLRKKYGTDPNTYSVTGQSPQPKLVLKDDINV